MQNVVRAAGLTVLAAMAAGSLSARTVHVDNVRGDDARDGAVAGTAVRSLARGVSLCGPGDVLSLAASEIPYSEGLVFSGKGGTPAAPITVEGNGAVLSGLRAVGGEEWREAGPGLFLLPAGKGPRGAAMPYPTAAGERLPEVRNPDALQSGM